MFTGSGYVEALLVDDGRVVASGSEAEIRRAAPTGTAFERLEGRLLVPGLIDAHLHLAELARTFGALDVGSARTSTDLSAAVAAWSREHAVGPVIGRGWDPERLRDAGTMGRALLDRVDASRPILLYHVSGHAAVANTATLDAAAAVGPMPADRAVVRDVDGTPTGVLLEEGVRWAAAAIADRGAVEPSALDPVFRRLLAHGLTSVATMNARPPELAALAERDGAGTLPIRVAAYAALDAASAAREVVRVAPPGDRLRLVGVKAFVDGAFGPRTAWLTSAYSDAPEEAGIPVGADAELAERIAAAAGSGLAPAVHAIGDRGLARALALIAPWANDPERPPSRIEHAALTPPELLPVLDAVRPTLVVQPGFVLSDHWLGRRLGPPRARWAYAFRTLLDRGLPLAGSSDAPFDPLDPWRGIRAAITRADPLGRSANPAPAEALPAEEALRLYTAAAADAIGDPGGGRLTAGGRADLVVVDAPDLPRALGRGDVPVRETWVGGRRVYAAGRAEPPTTV